MSAVSGLDGVFAPTAVAVYGASRNPAKLGHTLLKNVLDSGFEGRVLAVNPAGEEVLGVECRPSLPEPVDLALISVPAPACPDAVADAARAGCRVAVVLASGFGETGLDGRRIEVEMAATARAHGMRLIGPNCMGVVSRLDPPGARGGWFNGSYFWRIPEVVGGVGFASQSGAFGGMFIAECHRRRLGVSRFLSLGNCADVTEGDVLEYLAADPQTRVVGLFCEGVRDGRRFIEAARAVTRSKPMVVLKAGKEAAGARAAASHTGSLAGAHGAFQAALDRAGAIEALDSDAFFDTLAVLAAPFRPGGSGRGAAGGLQVAIITISGGPGVLAADAAQRAGLKLVPPAPATRARLRELVPSFAALGNPIDLTPQCPAGNFPAAIRAIFEDGGFEGCIVINCGLDLPEFGRGVVEAQRATGLPTVAFVLDTPRIEAELDAAGIPRLSSPERAVAAFAAGGRS